MSIADQLITRGWCKGQMWDEEGRVCLRGACFKEVEAHGLYGDAFDQADFLASIIMNRIVDEEKGQFYPGISTFNDADETIFDDALQIAKLTDAMIDELKELWNV